MISKSSCFLLFNHAAVALLLTAYTLDESVATVDVVLSATTVDVGDCRLFTMILSSVFSTKIFIDKSCSNSPKVGSSSVV